MKILVDADSFPREARKMVLRFSSRLGIKTIFAANRLIPGLPSLQENADAVMELCPTGEGSADDRIVLLAEAGDIALTRDIPLAERLVENGIRVIDDRGRVFTRENVRELRSLRDFKVSLAENGMDFQRTHSYGKKELGSFANSLDRELVRHIKNNAALNPGIGSVSV